MINLFFARRTDRGNLRSAQQKTITLGSATLVHLMRRLAAILWFPGGMGEYLLDSLSGSAVAYTAR